MAKAMDCPISMLETFRDETCSGYLIQSADDFWSAECGEETRAPQTKRLRFSSIQAEKFQHLISDTDFDFRVGSSVNVR